LYARDLGIRETGQMPAVGTFVGVAAAQALAEPISQGATHSTRDGRVSMIAPAPQGGL
jgi:hypothetical protein